MPLTNTLTLVVLALVPGQADQATRRTVVRCSVPTPKNWERDSVIEAYKTASELNGWLCLTDPLEWWQVKPNTYQNSQLFKNLEWQAILFRQHPVKMFIQLDPYRPPRKGTLSSKLPPELKGQTFASKQLRDAFITEAVARVRWYDAQYVALGMEVNAYHEEHPDDFDNFVSLFAEAREAIKKVKPDAIVFVSFQYEQLLGRTGLKLLQPKHEPRWELFKRFEPYQDAVGISSYPIASGVKDPAELPEDYYTRIGEHTDKPIVFAELGWSTDPKLGGPEKVQADFLRRFADLTRTLDVRLVNYYFLFDCKGFGGAFDHMGLLDSAGNPKEAYHVWKGLWDPKGEE